MIGGMLRKEMLWLGVGTLITILALSVILSGERYRLLEVLERPAVSEGDRRMDMIVVREDGSLKGIEIDLSAQRCSEEEAWECFREVWEILPEMIRGQNPSLDQINSDLVLPDRIENVGVELRWKSDHPNVLSGNGRLTQNRELSEALEVTLEVTMTLQGFMRTEELLVTVLPGTGLSWEERLARELHRLEQEAGGDQLTLPSEFEGETLSFVQRKDLSLGAGAAFLPMVLGLLIYMKGGREKEQFQKKRREEIMLDYPEVVVKMTVLYQAGMSMRNVWERIAADERRKGNKIRAIYEEVTYACNCMNDGVPEAEAYRQFGRRCATASCLKLGNLLASNVRRGTRQLSELMAEESSRAWEQRKHLARRNGEKAGTKMLLPMFMMFGVVLAIVVVPAFCGFM